MQLKALNLAAMFFAGTSLTLNVQAADAAHGKRFDGYWAVDYGATGKAKKLFKDRWPADAVFIDDAGSGELGSGEFAGLKLTAEAEQEIAGYDYHEELKFENSCIAPSVVFYMQAPFPMEIHQTDELIAFQIEYFDLYRLVFMDGRPHPGDDAPHSKSGHSIGHFEGDTLVVDTTHIASGTLMNNGLSHSDNVHLVEQFWLSDDGNTLYSSEVFTDPEVFSGTAVRLVAWSRREGEYIYPYDCDPSYGN